ncbi:GNAT family N-acetyltransferase [Sabulicella rubraurantiaca]|uniref:GNAT family N-acetyltransferase n=1 Tax=Sabulicella rubraurantiaca TaxID=2811429 RepID=UPI001A970D26|nr:GNAT family N-acetyltransferase [Sabulicella rubraurantiaca]
MTPRLAGPEEAALLAALHHEAFPPGEAWDEAAFAALLGSPGCFALSGEGGFVLARAAGGEAEIITIAVRPVMRRRGLGRILVEDAAAFAAALGAEEMFLEVEEDNAPALALYAALGFRRVGLRPGYYGAGRDAAVLRLPLKPVTAS